MKKFFGVPDFAEKAGVGLLTQDSDFRWNKILDKIGLSNKVSTNIFLMFSTDYLYMMTSRDSKTSPLLELQ